MKNMESLLPIRLTDKEGWTYLRYGLVLVLFMKKSHAEIADDVYKFYEGYIQAIGEDKLAWIHDRGSYFKPFIKNKFQRIKKKLTGERVMKHPDKFFTLQDLDNAAGNYFFEYSGENSEELKRQPDTTSYIEVWLPSDYVELFEAI
ncbi:MAG: type VI immunity family protein [bacterium]